MDEIVLFSQYPQWSCTTSTSSFIQAAKWLSANGEPFSKVTTIDRWYNHPLYIRALGEILAEDFKSNFEEGSDRDDTLILFTAHSIPIDFMSRGDTYPHEITASASLVAQYL